MTPVRLKPAALRSGVKHSTTEPLRSLSNCDGIHLYQTELKIPSLLKGLGLIMLFVFQLKVLPKDVQLCSDMATGVDSLGQYQFGDLVYLE